MTRPRLLDLFCGAGGAAMGYHRAGFDVVGVDVVDQPRYPFEFVQADAFMALTAMCHGEFGPIAAVHASPPCQEHSRGGSRRMNGTGWMLAATRRHLMTTCLPWVIENVPGAPMRVDYKLCGCMFGLRYLKRERWFETSWHGFELRPACTHPDPVICVTGAGTPLHTWKHYGSIPLARFREVMGIEWMGRAELSQAIPPAYTEYVGRQLLDHLKERAA